MKSIQNLKDASYALPLVAEDLTEFHAARLLLLILLCGNKAGELEGLTKLAKLDFFIRYPKFFDQVTGADIKSGALIEATMIRHFYGPWDKRYYDILAFLESRELVEVRRKTAKTYIFKLTDTGKRLAESLQSEIEFSNLVLHITAVSKRFKTTTGSALKRLIYDTFDQEIKAKRLGEVIS